MTVVRSRRAGISAEEARSRPLYARALGLQYLRPSGLLCFFFFEGAIALSALLALAELVDWWVMLILPVSVAAMVKVNDVIAGAVAYASVARLPKARGRAAVPRAGASRKARPQAVAAEGEVSGLEPLSPATPPAESRNGSRAQRARQSGARRYE